MTGLLVSVRNAEEAATAVLAGADLIDVKEPLAGSLGAASPDAVADVMLTVGGRRPTSIAPGELRENVAWSQYAERLSQVNLPRFVKFGLAGCWRPRPDKERDELIERWRTALAPLPATVGPVAVLYADWQAAESPPPEIILHCAKELHCRALLIDTFDKRGPGLLGVLPLDELADCVRAARDADMLVVLGGQIREEYLVRLLAMEPDYIAVRGAVCRGDRTGAVDRARVEHFRSRMIRAASGAAFASPTVPPGGQ